MKKYISPEFELIRLQVVNGLCAASDPADPAEGNEHIIDWGDPEGGGD